MWRAFIALVLCFYESIPCEFIPCTDLSFFANTPSTGAKDQSSEIRNVWHPAAARHWIRNTALNPPRLILLFRFRSLSWIPIAFSRARVAGGHRAVCRGHAAGREGCGAADTVSQRGPDSMSLASLPARAAMARGRRRRQTPGSPRFPGIGPCTAAPRSRATDVRRNGGQT